MSFLSKEVEELKEATRHFANREVIPVAHKIDAEQGEIPLALIAKMADMGFFAVIFPQEYGGLDLGALGLAVVTEELSRGWLSVGSLPGRNWLCGHILARSGTEEQKQRFLPGMASGQIQSASAGTEPEAGSDAANIKVRAVRKNDRYEVSGAKMWCTFANRANVLFTYCRTSNESKHRGISLLMAEKKPGDDFVPPTLTGSRIRTIGYHGMNTFQLFFDGFEIPKGNLVGGEEGRGFIQLMEGYELGRVQFAFRCIGVAQAAYEAALDYAKQRVQFNQPIAKFQAIRFRLADMATQIEAARNLGYLAAAKIDRGERADLEAGMVKLFASEMAKRVCNSALEIHGGNGLAQDFPVSRFWRDSALFTIGEGTSEVQREIIAKRILGER
ncbi:MAG TPA: acyl-CoA dehydrogenase family protein [Rhodoblastus sp.]|nr:acyl-CoA dehydrogenase family protein [Rhodoblastus sp.]